jgi:ATP-dependent DNA ligase
MSLIIEPCLPSPADKPPSSSNWIHEIKHDGYRFTARRDPGRNPAADPEGKGEEDGPSSI